jgi:hypothetical protein
MLGIVQTQEKTLGRKLVGLIAGSVSLLLLISSASAQEADATVKITRRTVAEAIGLSWGEGVLTYKGKDYPFSFDARGRLREVDPRMTAQELSGRVFNLKKLEDFNGNYTIVEGKEAAGGGTRATLKNQKGVVVNLVSTVEGRKFTLGREGMDIEIKKPKP